MNDHSSAGPGPPNERQRSASNDTQNKDKTKRLSVMSHLFHNQSKKQPSVLDVLKNDENDFPGSLAPASSVSSPFRRSFIGSTGNSENTTSPTMHGLPESSVSLGATSAVHSNSSESLPVSGKLTKASVAANSYSSGAPAPSDLKALLSSVDDNQTSAVISLSHKIQKAQNATDNRTSSPENEASKNLQLTAQLQGMFHEDVPKNVTDGFQCSSETKDMSSQLKDEFNKKYGTLGQALEDGKQYNPLEYIRKRNQEHQTHRKSVSGGNEKRNSWLMDQKIIPAVITEKKKDPAPVTVKKRWSLFGSKRSKEQDLDAVLSENSDQKSQKIRNDEDNISQSSKSNLSYSEASSIHSKLEMTVKEDQLKSAVAPDTEDRKSFSRKETDISITSSGARENEISPISARSNLSPSTASEGEDDDKNKRRKRNNISKMRDKFLGKIESHESVDEVSPDKSFVEVVVTDTDSKSRKVATEKPRKTLSVKPSLLSMKSNATGESEEQALKIQRYLRNLDKFEKQKQNYEYEDYSYRNCDEIVVFLRSYSKSSPQKNRISLCQKPIYQAAYRVLDSRFEQTNSAWSGIKEQSDARFLNSNDSVDKENEYFKAKRDDFMLELTQMSQEFSVLMTDQIQEVEELQNEMAEDINRSIRHLAVLSEDVNKKLVPGLNILKLQARDILVANSNTLTTFIQEIGYVLLAFLLNFAGYGFWAYAIIRRTYRRIRGFQDEGVVVELSPSSRYNEALSEVSDSDYQSDAPFSARLSMRRPSFVRQTSPSRMNQ